MLQEQFLFTEVQPQSPLCYAPFPSYSVSGVNSLRCASSSKGVPENKVSLPVPTTIGLHWLKFFAESTACSSGCSLPATPFRNVKRMIDLDQATNRIQNYNVLPNSYASCIYLLLLVIPRVPQPYPSTMPLSSKLMYRTSVL